MGERDDLAGLRPDHTFDGGDLDCGSGLVLLIRDGMSAVPPAGVLEIRSREVSVQSDLPPWCRMVGHEYLGSLEGAGFTRYFVRRGTGAVAEAEARALEEDKRRARNYEWRLRARSVGALHTKVYCRNLAWSVGQPLSFQEHDEHASAVEHLLGALAADLCTGFSTALARAGLDVDDVELTVRGRLRDAMAHLGLAEGDPAFSAIDVKCFASTMDDAERVREVWQGVVRRSPIAATLRKAVDVSFDLGIV
jgi:TusA-related sulfurtransferase